MRPTGLFVRRTTINSLVASLDLAPENVLRRFGTFVIAGINSGKPEICLVEGKRSAGITISPDDAVVTGIGVSRESCVVRLSIASERQVRSTLATRLAKAIDIPGLKFGDHGHATYGYFDAGLKIAPIHFLYVQGGESSLKITDIDETPVTRLAFVSQDDRTIVLHAIAARKLYKAELSLDAVRSGLAPIVWEEVTVPAFIGPVNDLTTRIENREIVVEMGTESGIYSFVDGQFRSYEATRGLRVTQIASFAGVGTPLSGMAFVTASQGSKPAGLWVTPQDLSARPVRIEVGEDWQALLGQGQAEVILGNDGTYLAAPGMETAFYTSTDLLRLRASGSAAMAS